MPRAEHSVMWDCFYAVERQGELQKYNESLLACYILSISISPDFFATKNQLSTDFFALQRF